MGEIDQIIKDLESIFSVVNATSGEAATTLMSVIQRLNNLKFDINISLDELVKSIENNPDMLADLILALGPRKFIEGVLQARGIFDNIQILSDRIPSLDTYPIEKLKQYKKQLEQRNDEMSKFMLGGIKRNLKRREEKEDLNDKQK